MISVTTENLIKMAVWFQFDKYFVFAYFPLWNTFDQFDRLLTKALDLFIFCSYWHKHMQNVMRFHRFEFFSEFMNDLFCWWYYCSSVMIFIKIFSSSFLVIYAYMARIIVDQKLCQPKTSKTRPHAEILFFFLSALSK